MFAVQKIALQGTAYLMSHSLFKSSSYSQYPTFHAWWRLAAVKGIGIVSLNKIYEALNDRVLDSVSDEKLRQIGLSETQLKSFHNPSSKIQKSWRCIVDWLQLPNNGVLLREDPLYPEPLKQLLDAPIFLFYKGDTSILNTPCIAMVGSRNVTHYGEQHAIKIAKELSQQGVTIVSGLAVGVDGHAHRGALSSGINGSTIAVLGSGLDRIYPKRHESLATQIVQQGGLLLSEYMPDTSPKPEYFPQRNRLVSGLSIGTVVIEAAVNSGSLITARLAAEQGREVFALPGVVNNSLSRGCHHLIKDGAILIENAEDIVRHLQGTSLLADAIKLSLEVEGVGDDEISDLAGDELLARDDLTKDEKVLMEALDYVPVAMDMLMVRTGFDVAYISQLLLMLELKGAVQQSQAGYLKC